MQQSGQTLRGPPRELRQHAPTASFVDETLIYDIGAHLGEDTDLYLKLGYRVIAVEANPELAAKLRARLAEAIATGRLVVFEKAIMDGCGTIPFFVNASKTVWGTANADWATRNARVGAPSKRIAVSATPFAAIVREFGMPYYLKIDIEGSDHMCMAGLGEFEARPKFISIEASVSNWADLVQEFKTLESLGYKKFQIVRQGDHPSRKLVSLSGDPVAVSFNEDSSGPFGDDLRGTWLSAPQALRRYWWLWLREKLYSYDTPLGRLFARIPILARLPLSVGWYDTHAKL